MWSYGNEIPEPRYRMKLLTALLLLIVLASHSSGQGTVTFQNSVAFQTVDPTGGGRLVYDCGSPLSPTTGVGLSGTQYVAELYFGADASSLQPLTGSISRFRGTTTQNKGKWATTGIYGPNDFVALPGYFPGQTVTLEVKVWDFRTATTYEAATGFTLSSAPFAYTIPAPADAPFKFYMEGLQAFACAPEPSTVSLSFMGLGVLLVWARNKRKC